MEVHETGLIGTEKAIQMWTTVD